MKYWTQNNTVNEAFSDSYCRLMNHDSFSIHLFTYGLNLFDFWISGPHAGPHPGGSPVEGNPPGVVWWQEKEKHRTL